jgi:hypothetical protein
MTPHTQKILNELQKKWNKEKKSAATNEISPHVRQAIKNLDNVSGQDGRDYMVLVREYQAQHGVDICTAMREVEKRHPHKLREYIKANNPRINFD